MAELISMVEFVLKIDKTYSPNTNQWYRCLNYATFLKQPLEIWMFVPCKLVDGNWVVLEEPKTIAQSIIDNDNSKEWAIKTFEYRQAKSLCIFEGFELDSFGYAYNGEIRISFPSSDTIEAYSDYRFKLTPAAETFS